ncbi:MAG: putative toxin-antitoxin system toxin component, PIN family [Desulfobacterales bacterium]|nr:putative toxin-antitoxin system toxin component, PIN family [Desulfobacterales bacterium]
MIVVLDTNVFISGIFFSGPPSKILEAWRNKCIQILLSQEILNEYRQVAEALASKFPAVDILPIIEMVTIHGQFVDHQDIDIFVCEDPDDDKFFECAVAGKCQTIVSGDQHLLKLSGFQDIMVLKPRDFFYVRK